jgi:hypothetical protein
MALLFVIAGSFTLLAGITTLEAAVAQASRPILTELEVLFIALLSLFLYFQWPTLNYMPHFHHFSILNTVYTHSPVFNYFTTLHSLRRGCIWCQ